MSTAISVSAILATAVASHYLASFIQAVLHQFVGHHPRGRFFYRTHVRDHHGRYPGDATVSEKYSDEERDIAVFYLVPAVLLAVTAYLLLPLAIFVTHAASLAASYGAHVYVHVQYHLARPWLNRFAWFRRRRQLHFVHHREPTKNFAVIDFVWDRLGGTYQPARQGR